MGYMYRAFSASVTGKRAPRLRIAARDCVARGDYFALIAVR